MEEDSLRFWIAPIVFLIVGFGIFAIVVEYNFNTKIPNAVVELDEMRTMSCEEIESKNTLNRYWSLENRAFGNSKASSCADAASAIKIAAQEKLDALLADPNSFESLTRDLKKFQDLYDTHSELYESHATQADILKQNVTDFENQINEINSKLEQNYGLIKTD